MKVINVGEELSLHGKLATGPEPQDAQYFNRLADRRAPKVQAAAGNVVFDSAPDRPIFGD